MQPKKANAPRPDTVIEKITYYCCHGPDDFAGLPDDQQPVKVPGRRVGSRKEGTSKKCGCQTRLIATLRHGNPDHYHVRRFDGGHVNKNGVVCHGDGCDPEIRPAGETAPSHKLATRISAPIRRYVARQHVSGTDPEKIRQDVRELVLEYHQRLPRYEDWEEEALKKRLAAVSRDYLLSVQDISNIAATLDRRDPCCATALRDWAQEHPAEVLNSLA